MTGIEGVILDTPSHREISQLGESAHGMEGTWAGKFMEKGESGPSGQVDGTPPPFATGWYGNDYCHKPREMFW